MSSSTALDYFDFIARMGVTKHPGGMAATRELISLCHIGAESYVLDVGCGVGATPVYLATATGCRVVGVDLLDEMVEQARRRADAAGVADRVEFRTADAQDLPFEDNLFDAVVSESVNVFLDVKHRAMSEYVRVSRSGGYVGMAEGTWLKPPGPELVDFCKWTAFMHPLEASGWRGVMEQAGLVDVTGDARKMDVPQESRGLIERYGCLASLRALPRTLVLIIKDRNARRFMRQGVGSVSRDMLNTVGYGVYVGRKP